MALGNPEGEAGKIEILDDEDLAIAHSRGVVVTRYELDEDLDVLFSCVICPETVAAKVLKDLLRHRNAVPEECLGNVWTKFLSDAISLDEDQFTVNWFESIHDLPLTVNATPPTYDMSQLPRKRPLQTD